MNEKIKKLTERKISIETLLNQRIDDLIRVEQMHKKLTEEIIHIKGKISLLNEMINEQKQEDEK